MEYLYDYFYDEFDYENAFLYSSYLSEIGNLEYYIKLGYLVGWQDYGLSLKNKVLSFLRFHCENNPLNVYTYDCYKLSDEVIKYDYNFLSNYLKLNTFIK